jgi:hypothetical protein
MNKAFFIPPLMLLLLIACAPSLERIVFSHRPTSDRSARCAVLTVFGAQCDTIHGTLLQRITHRRNFLASFSCSKMMNDTAFLKNEACDIGANLINISSEHEADLYSVDGDELNDKRRYGLDSVRHRDSVARYSNPEDPVVDYRNYGDFDKRYLLWFFPSENTITNGISIGVYNRKGEISNSTNGIRMELFGAGIFHFLFHPSGAVVYYSPEEYDKVISTIPFLENVNGLNFSLTGTFLGEVKGLSVGGLSSVYGRMMGLSVAVVNSAWDSRGLQLGVETQNFKSRGIQLGVVRNTTQVLRGIQIGLFNESRVTKGIQIGLWNVNEKRSLPFFNANF